MTETFALGPMIAAGKSPASSSRCRDLCSHGEGAHRLLRVHLDRQPLQKLLLCLPGFKVTEELTDLVRWLLPNIVGNAIGVFMVLERKVRVGQADQCRMVLNNELAPFRRREKHQGKGLACLRVQGTDEPFPDLEVDPLMRDELLRW